MSAIDTRGYHPPRSPFPCPCILLLFACFDPSSPSSSLAKINMAGFIHPEPHCACVYPSRDHALGRDLVSINKQSVSSRVINYGWSLTAVISELSSYYQLGWSFDGIYAYADSIIHTCRIYRPTPSGSLIGEFHTNAALNSIVPTCRTDYPVRPDNLYKHITDYSRCVSG